MAHPYKSQADGSNKSKMSSMHKTGNTRSLPNLDMQGSYKDVKGSTSSMQHKDQSAAPGMKRGGRLDKASRGKSKSARDMAQASSPSPEDMIASQAGAGGISPSPSPAPYAKGGRIKYPLKKGGADSGVGRLEKAKNA